MPLTKQRKTIAALRHHETVIKALKKQSKKLNIMKNEKNKLEVKVSVLEDKIKEQSLNHEEEKKSLKLEKIEKKELEVKLSVSENRIKENSKNHEEEKKSLKLEMKAEKDKCKHVLGQMKDKIECPVCMEIPRRGPVPVCPNGHFVCKKCKTGSCPTCRVAMGNGQSLLAVDVIENVKHVCKFVECEESFAIDKLDDHEKICPHRIILCPHGKCSGKLALSKMLIHFGELKCCSTKDPTVVVKNSQLRQADFRVQDGTHLALQDFDFGLNSFSYCGRIFALVVRKFDNSYYITMVMLGSREECSKYFLQLVVHERDSSSENSEVSFIYRGKPCSIDEDKNQQVYLGLTVNNMAMEQIIRKNKDFVFTVSFTIQEKQI